MIELPVANLIETFIPFHSFIHISIFHYHNPFFLNLLIDINRLCILFFETKLFNVNVAYQLFKIYVFFKSKLEKEDVVKYVSHRTCPNQSEQLHVIGSDDIWRERLHFGLSRHTNK